MAHERRDNKSLPRGCPRKTDGETGELLAERAMAAPTQPLKELRQAMAPDIAPQTILRLLREKDIKKYRQRVKLPLSASHRS